MIDHQHHPYYPQLLQDLLRAWRAAARRKGRTAAAVDFSRRALLELDSLARELLEESYRPRPSLAFVVTDPVLREVVAADFRDRVIHHYICDYLTPIVERHLIHDCYSCRVGKGTGYGVDRLEHHIRSASHCYRDTAYCLQLDIRGYFVHIRRDLLLHQVRQLMDRLGEERDESGIRDRDRPRHHIVSFLIDQLLLREDPMRDAILVGDRSLMDRIPHSKSLRYAPPGCGLPIGNLTSQLFSNIYLSPMDHFIKRELHVRHYGRYVDDLFLVDRSRTHLMSLIDPIRHFLREAGTGLSLHPRKVKINEVHRGITFLGVTITPHGRHLKRGTFRRLMESYDDCLTQLSTGDKEEATESTSASLASIIGLIRHTTRGRG